MTRFNSGIMVAMLACWAGAGCSSGAANVFIGDTGGNGASNGAGGAGASAGHNSAGGNGTTDGGKEAAAAGHTSTGGNAPADASGESAAGGNPSTDGSTSSDTGQGGDTLSNPDSGIITDASAEDSSFACTLDLQCAGSDAGAYCNQQTGQCVVCLPSSNTCGTGKYCDPSTYLCTPGCAYNQDCTSDGSTLYCDSSSHQCVGCLIDDNCPLGSVCNLGTCVAGCTPQHGCPNTETCCGPACADTTSDPAHCGTCDACAAVPNATTTCASSTCGFTCNSGFADCNGLASDGCEHDVTDYGACVCTAGTNQNCYDGAPATLGAGPCHGGTQICDSSGLFWQDCVGEVLPIAEICANNIDDNCDGIVDNVPDLDGDGWTRCNGDCCDDIHTGCANNPALVNPGAYDDPTDGIDNDCDGVVDNPMATTCSTAQKFAGVTSNDVAYAMELCQFTTANAPLPQRKWGVIQTSQLLANGTTPGTTALSDIENKQTAVTTLFGSTISPRKNATFAVISTGMARDDNDTGWVSPVPGTLLTTSISFPGAGPLGTYTSAHGNGLLPGHCGTSTCPVGLGAYDSVDIHLQIRVPTNAKGFSYDFRFFSAEYYTYQCTKYNDYYLAMLTSGAATIPADHNISFDSLNNPVSVNNGFFQDCGGNGKNCGTCPGGVSALAGTGFDGVNGGATEWLTTDAPIVPGETITLDLMVFDVSDHELDTLVLLDNFRWSLTPVTLGTHTN